MRFPPLKPGQVLHHLVQAGVYACGATERQGERGTMRKPLVTCPACLALNAAKRAAAKARAQKGAA